MSQAQHKKILEKMAHDTVQKGKKWFIASDFVMNEDGSVYVGYEASARLSELARDYSLIIECERQGKYVARSINRDAVVSYYGTLPDWMQDIFYQTRIYDPKQWL